MHRSQSECMDGRGGRLESKLLPTALRARRCRHVAVLRTGPSSTRSARPATARHVLLLGLAGRGPPEPGRWNGVFSRCALALEDALTTFTDPTPRPRVVIFRHHRRRAGPTSGNAVRDEPATAPRRSRGRPRRCLALARGYADGVGERIPRSVEIPYPPPARRALRLGAFRDCSSSTALSWAKGRRCPRAWTSSLGAGLGFATSSCPNRARPIYLAAARPGWSADTCTNREASPRPAPDRRRGEGWRWLRRSWTRPSEMVAGHIGELEYSTCACG